MLEELRRNTTIGDGSGILFFTEQICYGNESTIDGIDVLCKINNNIRINTNFAIKAFVFLGLIETKGKFIYLTRKGLYLKNKSHNGKVSEILSSIIFRFLLEKKIILIDDLRLEYENETLKYEILHFPLNAAIFRNLLLSINELNLIQGKYLLPIKNGIEPVARRMITRQTKQISESELLKSLEAKRLQGELAEKWVYNFELKRLSEFKFVNKIKIISKIDVAAGFDILSFNDNNSIKFDRLIEVKSFSGHPQFYWSKNEREVALTKGNSYFIYLVDFNQISNKNYFPIIIQNPVYEIENNSNWLVEVETIKVSKIPEFIDP
jgi:hypothetical protein